ncbi:MAG: polyprenyl synthetase family protein, partial [Oscillochloris sp.]|nr:polyprenyl synthetase family protein [Oscillochloris sp.]
DLVDEAERRLGHARQGDWNHGVSLMVGDYLFALASGEMALSPDPRVISFYSQAVMRICESELAPVPALRPFEQAREQYFTHTGGMAAALYEAACRSGAACGGLSAEQIEVLGLFGHQIGLALCIVDELGDFAPDEARGSSLYHGLVTLPLIYAADLGDGARLEQALAAGDTDLDWALAEVRRYGLAPARAEISRCVVAARAALAEIAPSPARTALEQVADYVERS